MSDVCKCTVTQAETDRNGEGWHQQTLGTKNWRAVYASVFLQFSWFVSLRVENEGPYFPAMNVCGFTCEGRKPIKWFMNVMWWLSCSNVLTCGLNLILVWNLYYDYTLSDKNEKHKISFYSNVYKNTSQIVSNIWLLKIRQSIWIMSYFHTSKYILK